MTIGIETHRVHRRRGHRQRVGGPVRPERESTPPSLTRTRTPKRKAYEVLDNAERAFVAPVRRLASGPRRAADRGERRRCGRRRWIHSGKRAGAARSQAHRPRRDRCGGAAGRGHRIVDVRAPPERHAARPGAPRAHAGRASVSIPSHLLPLVGGRGAAGHVRRRGRACPADVYASVGMKPVVVAKGRSTRSSAIGSRRRSGARRCGSSTTASPRSRTSTTSSATRSACGGRRWASSRCTGWRGAKRACVTSWSSSGRALRGRGRSSPTSLTSTGRSSTRSRNSPTRRLRGCRSASWSGFGTTNLIGIMEALERTGGSGWGAGALLREARRVMRDRAGD